MSWSIEEHIGECRPWPAQVVVYRGETDECLAYVSGEVADHLKAENAKLRELVRAYQEVAKYPTCRLYDECKPHPFSHTCAECDGDSCLIQRLSDELRELGVEVDGEC